MSRAVIFVGLPASGKSTLVLRTATNIVMLGADVFVYSTDNIIEAVADLTSQTYNDVFLSTVDFAKKSMDAALAKHSENGTTILWDQTNLSVKKRKEAVEYLKSRNYEVGCVYVQVPENNSAEWSERLNSRPGKNIPAHVLKNMMNSIVEPTMDEGYAFVSTVNTFVDDDKIIDMKGSF